MANESLPNSQSFGNQITVICSKCGVQKVAALIQPDPRKASGLGTICKECVYRRRKAWAQANKAKLAEQARERWGKCERTKELSKARAYRWRKENRERYLEVKRLETYRRRAKVKGLSVEEYLAERDQRRLNVKPPRLRIDGLILRKNQRVHCPLVILMRKRVKARENAKARYHANVAQGRAKVRNWKKENPAKVSAQHFRRRVRWQSIPTTLTEEQWNTIKASYRHRCAYCGKRRRLTQDHVIPVSDTNRTSHTAPNIVPACQSCNSSKGNRPNRVEYQPHLIC